MSTTDDVRWKPLATNPKYRVNTLGSVIGIRGSVLKPQITEDGHFKVWLYFGSKKSRKMAYIHRLVLETFVGPAPEGKPEACHRDGDPSNNTLTNLYWGSRQDNTLDQYKHGTTNRGMRHPQRKIDRTIVDEIRAQFDTGQFTIAEIARSFDLQHRHVSYIVHRQIWV